MFRHILIPGAVLIACMVGAVSLSLWALFHSQFQSTWSPDEAYNGDIPAQRHLASCYATGCAIVPRDPASACAWRRIIAIEDSRPLPADISAEQKACSQLAAIGQKWVTSLEADIRLRIREDQSKRL